MAKNFRTAKSACMALLFALMVLALGVGQAYGQAQTATVSGTATDASPSTWGRTSRRDRPRATSS